MLAGAIIAGGGLLVTSFVLGLHARPVSTKTPTCPQPAVAQTAPITAPATVPPPIQPQPPAGALDSTSADTDADDPSGYNEGVAAAAPNNSTSNYPPRPAQDPAFGGPAPSSPPMAGAPLPSGQLPANPPPNPAMLTGPAPDSPPPPNARVATDPPVAEQSWPEQSWNEPPGAEWGRPAGPAPRDRFNPGRRHYRPGEGRERPEGPLHRAVSGLGGL
jgi:hypothetical protein